ncbi:MAG: tRNA pseudouridine(38-40) synthase TruA [Chloroflexota bacterium]|nr:tRNA pseudouridine(38-40) synthase TruA [Chloroflexota bacterium]MDE2959616.1 tRNA pseudouridine(38-40) synthase TruA [Chloroflexota bacterium]
MTSQRTVEAAQRRIALVVAYEGTQYAGFQLQADVPTIQGELEMAFSRLTGENARVRGASRTDSGAHAIFQVVDLPTGSTHETRVIMAAMNHYLPDDIRVITASEVPEEFHARRSATRRDYRYSIVNRPVPSPLLRRTHHEESAPLNIDAMRRAAQSLLGIRDFRQIATAHPADQSAVRQVFRWDVKRQSDDRNVIVIDCAANGFLRHQIRRANAVLVEIGKGRLPIHAVPDALAGRTQQLHNIPTLPAKGLCLQHVHYPEFNHLLKVASYHETI